MVPPNDVSTKPQQETTHCFFPSIVQRYPTLPLQHLFTDAETGLNILHCAAQGEANPKIFIETAKKFNVSLEAEEIGTGNTPVMFCSSIKNFKSFFEAGANLRHRNKAGHGLLQRFIGELKFNLANYLLQQLYAFVSSFVFFAFLVLFFSSLVWRLSAKNKTKKSLQELN